MTQRELSYYGVGEFKVTLWIKKRKGKIIYLSSFKGEANSLKEMVEQIKEKAKNKNILWLIRVLPETEKTFTKEDVEFIRSLNRWGCIADDYELCGKKSNLEREFYLK